MLTTYLLPKESQQISNVKLKIYSIILSGISILVFIVIVPLLVENFFSDYHESIFPIQIMSISIFPTVLSIIMESSLLGREKSKNVLIANISQVSTFILLIFVLGNEYGLIGLATAFLISEIVRTIVNTFSYNKHKNT